MTERDAIYDKDADGPSAKLGYQILSLARIGVAATDTANNMGDMSGDYQDLFEVMGRKAAELIDYTEELESQLGMSGGQVSAPKVAAVQSGANSR